jgi:hypothetical protein
MAAVLQHEATTFLSYICISKRMKAGFHNDTQPRTVALAISSGG